MTRTRHLQNAGMDRVDRLARVAAATLLLAAGGATGCGLLPKQDIGFRTYKLEGVGYDQAATIVQEVTRQQANQLFGGVTLTWDPAQGNLQLDPVFDGQRRLRLYIHLAPAGNDVNVEMFALVDHLQVEPPNVGYGDAQQDVHLEEKLFQAYVTELLRRREEGG